VRIEQDFGLIPERYVYVLGPDGAGAVGSGSYGTSGGPGGFPPYTIPCLEKGSNTSSGSDKTVAFDYSENGS